MSSQGEDWQVQQQGRRIDRLESDLYKAQEKIRELERRPMEWLLKAELMIMCLVAAAIWVYALIEIANKH